MTNGKELSEEEKRLLDLGFLNAIGTIYHGLGTDEEKATFKQMASATIGDSSFESGVNEKLVDSSADGGCPANCTWVAGVGCLCDEQEQV